MPWICLPIDSLVLPLHVYTGLQSANDVWITRALSNFSIQAQGDLMKALFGGLTFQTFLLNFWLICLSAAYFNHDCILRLSWWSSLVCLHLDGYRYSQCCWFYSLSCSAPNQVSSLWQWTQWFYHLFPPW